MATSALIGKLNRDDTVTYIYNHFDGYPEGVLKTLQEAFNELPKVLTLIDGGDTRSIHVNGHVDDYLSNGHDWDEVKPKTISKEDYINGDNLQLIADYRYLFVDGEWFQCEDLVESKRSYCYEEFMMEVDEYAMNHPSQRYGQILFNTLFKIDSTLASNIYCSSINPFYAASPEVIKNFMNYVEEKLG